MSLEWSQESQKIYHAISSIPAWRENLTEGIKMIESHCGVAGQSAFAIISWASIRTDQGQSQVVFLGAYKLDRCFFSTGKRLRTKAGWRVTSQRWKTPGFLPQIQVFFACLLFCIPSSQSSTSCKASQLRALIFFPRAQCKMCIIFLAFSPLWLGMFKQFICPIAAVLGPQMLLW